MDFQLLFVCVLISFLCGAVVGIITFKSVLIQKLKEEENPKPQRMWNEADWKPIVNEAYPLTDHPEVKVIVTEVDQDNESVSAKLKIPLPAGAIVVNMTKKETDDDWNSDWYFDITYRVGDSPVTTTMSFNLLGCEYIEGPDGEYWDIEVVEHNFIPMQG